MKRWFASLLILTVLLGVLGCARQRLSEEEYAKKAIDAYRQGRLDEAWSNYRSLLSYYPESPKADQYRAQLAEVLVKLAKESPQNLSQGYLDELKAMGAASDTLLAWLNFQSAAGTTDSTKAAASYKEITFTGYLLAAQYAINRMRFRDALSAYDKAIEIYPKDPQAYKALFLAGFVASEYIKDKGKAQNYYKRVIDDFPESDLADDAQWMLENMDNPPDKITFINTDTTKKK